MTGFSLDDAHRIAEQAHRGQVDKLGVDYLRHVEAVAAGLIDFDLDLQIAGMLHDVIEDSDLTPEDLRAKGVPERAVAAVVLVSRNLHAALDYAGAIELACGSHDAALVKISDNAHNSLPHRVTALTALTGEPPHPRYAAARSKLFCSVPHDDVEAILRRVNPALLSELNDSGTNA